MNFAQQSSVNSPYSLIYFISFCAFSKWTYCHSAHSPNMLNELGMPGKISPLWTRPGKFKGISSRKNRCDILPWLRENKNKYLFLAVLPKTFHPFALNKWVSPSWTWLVISDILSSTFENALYYEKSMTNCPNSANVGPRSKICKINKFYPRYVGWNGKKTSHATVSLNVWRIFFLILCITTATPRLVSWFLWSINYLICRNMWICTLQAICPPIFRLPYPNYQYMALSIHQLMEGGGTHSLCSYEPEYIHQPSYPIPFSLNYGRDSSNLYSCVPHSFLEFGPFPLLHPAL